MVVIFDTIQKNHHFFMKRILIPIISLFIITSANAKNLNQYVQEAEQKNPNSAYKAGLAFEFGVKNSVNRDINRAVRYYIIAHDGGVVRATSRLGVINYETRNYNEALKYFKIGAEKKESLSQAYLGKILENNKKYDRAIQFYRESVKDNNPVGKKFLGEYLIKNNPKGSNLFLEGYALLVSASKKNAESKQILSRYPYKFNKEEQKVLLKYINQYN